MRRNNDKSRKGKKKQHVGYESITPIDVDDFEPTKGSLHRVTTHRKEKKPDRSSSAWVVKHLKPTSEKPTIFELEGAAGDFYRLLIGSREPKGRPIMGEDTPTGLMSKLIDGYVPISTRPIDLGDNNHIKQLAEISTIALFLEEQDLHDDNLGFNRKGDLIKIDHGQSLWSIAKEYHVGGRGKDVDFSMTADEIRNLPFLRKEHSAKICPLNDEQVETLINNPVFIAAKFKSLLKIALMPDEVCHSITDAFISDEGLQNHVSTHLINKRDALLETLMSMPEFGKFMIENPNVINEIILEYKEFNNEFHKEKHAHRRIDIIEVKNRYDLINHEITSSNLKYTILAKLQTRIDALSSGTGMLATIKLDYLNELKSALDGVSSNEHVIELFDNWLQTKYQANGKDDAKFDGLTCEEILGKRRKWDPSTPKSLKFINEVKTLIKDMRKESLDLYAYDDDYDNKPQKTIK